VMSLYKWHLHGKHLHGDNVASKSYHLP
jgi:hypothetical protein